MNRLLHSPVSPFHRIFGPTCQAAKLFGLVLLLSGALAGQAQAEDISKRDLLGHITVLASDAFAGRKPGTEGEDKTIAYIAGQWMQAGLSGGMSDGGWFQRALLYEYPDGWDGEAEQYWSFNVVGKLAGRDPTAGAIIFMGHWDHFGQCRPDGEVDRICNGAVDNASGIALLIELAKRLASEGPFDRDIYFLATTGEELGLLGARAFVADAPLPLDQIVAVFNVDTVALSDQTEQIAIIGGTEAGLPEQVAELAGQAGLSVSQDEMLAQFGPRQDGWVFSEQGVPAVMINSGFADADALEAFLMGRYHAPDDEADGELVLGGAVADANFHLMLARYFADAANKAKKATGADGPE